MGNVKRVGDLLSPDLLASLLNTNGQFDPDSLEKGRVSAKLFSTWAGIAGEAKIPAAADHSRIRELERGILLIEAEHPGWVQLLQTKQVQLLRLVQKKYPELEIQGISFCLSRESISRSAVPAAVSMAPLASSNETAPSGNDDRHHNNDDLHEPIKRFKNIIQKKNRKNTN